MYKYVLNLVIKISLMFAQYFEYYAIILRVDTVWTRFFVDRVYIKLSIFYQCSFLAVTVVINACLV